jgi:hypothetical protein
MIGGVHLGTLFHEMENTNAAIEHLDPALVAAETRKGERMSVKEAVSYALNPSAEPTAATATTTR